MTFKFDTGERVILVARSLRGKAVNIKGQILAGPCVEGSDGLFGWTNELTDEVDYVSMLFDCMVVIHDDSFDGIEVGTPVENRRHYYYGFVMAGPMEEGVGDAWNTLVSVADTQHDCYAATYIARRTDLVETSGCECGNPFYLCHPEA